MSLKQRYAELEKARAYQEDTEHNLRYTSTGEDMYVMSNGDIVPKADFRPDYGTNYNYYEYRVGRPVVQTNSYSQPDSKRKYRDEYYFN